MNQSQVEIILGRTIPVEEDNSSNAGVDLTGIPSKEGEACQITSVEAVVCNTVTTIGSRS